MSKIIGIDLGTTNSAVAYLDYGKPKIINDNSGKKTLPSIVCFKDDEIIIGEQAKKLEYLYPETTIKRIKRKMGTDYKFTYNSKEYTPEEISAMILKRLKEIAEEKIGTKITDAIITVPAYFNDNQRQATKIAGKIAGLNVLRIINEPTAAALAYGIKPEEDLNIVVYDLGGGTFDISVLNVSEGIFEVISTAGDNSLGGEDFNRRLAEFVINKFKSETNIDLTQDPLAIVKIYDAVEKAKIELSSVEKTKILVPFVTADENGPKNIEFEITRKEFETMISDYIERTIELTKQAIGDAHLQISDIDKIIMVGGSTRIPYVRESVKKLFQKEIDCSINPDEVVALGAAIQGGIIEGDISNVVLVDVIPMSLGIEVENGYFVPIIERNTPIPTSAKRIFTTVADSQRSVEIQVMQGESMYAKNNISLGKFRLEGIRNALKGEPRIEVNFEIDVNGILNVSAIDLDTQSTQGITIINHNRMSENELKELKDYHLKNYEDEIKKRRALTTVLKLKTKADNIAAKINSVVPPAYKKTLIENEIEEILANIEKAVKEIDIEKSEKNISRLEFILSEILAGTYNNMSTDVA